MLPVLVSQTFCKMASSRLSAVSVPQKLAPGKLYITNLQCKMKSELLLSMCIIEQLSSKFIFFFDSALCCEFLAVCCE